MDHTDRTRFWQLVTDAKVQKAARITAKCNARNHSDVEDIVHDAILLAERGYHTYRPEEDFQHWFCKVVKNCARSLYRRKKILRNKLASEVADDGQGTFHSNGSTHSNATSEQAIDCNSLLRLALPTLDASQLRTFHLHFIEECDYSEIAEKMGVPLNTVCTRVYRTRRKLQRVFEKQSA